MQNAIVSILALSLVACNPSAPAACERSPEAEAGTILYAGGNTLTSAPACAEEYNARSNRWRLNCRGGDVALVVWAVEGERPSAAPEGSSVAVSEIALARGAATVQGPAYGSTLTRRGDTFVIDALACERQSVPLRANGFVLTLAP